MAATEKYLKTLLRYYEEEVSGEAYFYGLAENSGQSEKFILLAETERRAAQSVVPLLEKYNLTPRHEAALKREGEGHVSQHKTCSWADFLHHILQRYPDYLVDFKGLEAMAPAEDLYALKILTEHEVAVIEFAKKELSDDADSLAPLLRYLNQ